MRVAANLLLFGFIALLMINGARLTFFPATTCQYARSNEVMSIQQSVMEFHRLQAEIQTNDE